VDVTDCKLQALLQQFNLSYINSLIQYLFQKELLQLVLPFHLPRQTGASTYVILRPEGIMQAEEWAQAYTETAQGFVAMSFDPILNDAWISGFAPGIRKAGFRPLRLDNEDYVGGITDEIMAQIRRSRFVVADYTAQRNSVYFEAGFALGLGLTVIPTCRAVEIPALHFDVKHLNTLPWSSYAELSDSLNRRIRAVIGTGPDDPNPS
jgi:hypothetical protein